MKTSFHACVTGSLEAVDFYRKAFNAELKCCYVDSTGKFVEHAELAINNQTFLSVMEIPEAQLGNTMYFFKADTPVPDGYSYYDVPTEHAAYAVYFHPDFDGDVYGASYEFTRDQILGDGVHIPYPQAYWTAEVFPKGFSQAAVRFDSDICSALNYRSTNNMEQLKHSCSVGRFL